MPSVQLTRPLVLVLATLVLLPSPCDAQRQEAKFDWQKHAVTIGYGVPRVGKHTIDELQQGSVWRMGNGPASVLTAETVLFGNDLAIPPGSYRCNVTRPDQSQFALNADGASSAIDPSAGDSATAFPGKMGKLDKATNTLELATKQEKAAGPNLPVTVAIRFGPNELTVPFTLAGTKTTKAGSWTVDVFTYPAEFFEKQLEAGRPLPVASFHKESGQKKHPTIYNLMLTKSAANLVPAMEAQTDAFKPVNKIDAAAVTKATSVTITDATDKKPFVEAVKIEAKKGEYQLTITGGTKTATIVVGEPAPKPAK